MSPTTIQMSELKVHTNTEKTPIPCHVPEFQAYNGGGFVKPDYYNNHSSLLSLWNLKIMKDTLRLLSFHLRYAVSIACPFGSSRGLPRASNLVNKSGSEPQLVYTPYLFVCNHIVFSHLVAMTNLSRSQTSTNHKLLTSYFCKRSFYSSSSILFIYRYLCHYLTLF
jgi:hypothetical protein